MAEKELVTFTCDNGEEYKFHISLLEDDVPSKDGNYIFAIADTKNLRWRAVYIGQGNLAERKAYHLRDGCVERKGATHFLFHVNQNKEDRLNKESNLLENFREAYEPNGCNKRLGG